MARLDTNSLARLIGEIYDAALEPTFWMAFLGSLQKTLDLDYAVLGLNGNQFSPSTFQLQASIDFNPAFAKTYNDHYGHKDIVLKTAYAEGLVREGALLKSHQVVPADVLEQSEFFNDWVRPQGVAYWWAPVFTIDEETVGFLTMARSREKGDLSAPEEEFLKLLIPHMQRAYEQYKRLYSVVNENKALLDALELVTKGVILIGEDGRVLEMNRQAREISRQKDGFEFTHGGKISLSDRRTHNEFYKYIDSSIETSVGRDVIPGGVLWVTRPSGKRPYNVVVSPVSLMSSASGRGTPFAAVFVVDPEAGMSAPTTYLQQLFGLTPAESRLSLYLASGYSLDEAAVDLKVTKHTVRSLLQRTYAKTNTNRQGELVSLLHKCNLSLSAR